MLKSDVVVVSLLSQYRFLPELDHSMIRLVLCDKKKQALRIRRAYVKAILNQDVGWFDEHPAGQLPTVATSNMAKVQDGMGRKIGDIVSNGLGGEYK